MRWKMLVVLAVSLLLAAEPAKKDAAEQELDKFTGSWKATSIERDGKPLPQDEVGKVTLVVKGNHYTYHMGKEVIQGTHKLDPSKTPKQIDAVRSNGPHAGEELKGIYTLEGDTYKACFGAPGKERPTEFSSTSGGGHRLIVMHRAKP